MAKLDMNLVPSHSVEKESWDLNTEEKLEVADSSSMAAEVYYQAISTLQSRSYLNNLNHHQKHQNNLVRLVSRDFISNNGLSTRRSNCTGQRNCSVIRSLALLIQCCPLQEAMLVTLTRNQAALILIRHGESLWNEKNLFRGCVDVLLSKKGIDEAIEAGKRISSIPSKAGVYAYTRILFVWKAAMALADLYQ
ncbi:2,3-bisphosphoglycerate-dependent phosphoglycerate mutase [Glycine soja]